MNIFELGLKKHITNVEYVLSYIDFLIQVNEDNNARSLFEKALQSIPSENSRPLWDRFLTFEHSLSSTGGNLSTVISIEERRAVALFNIDQEVPNTELLSIAHRYTFFTLRPSTRDDDGFYQRQGKQQEDVVDDSTNSTTTVHLKPQQRFKKRISGPTIADCLEPLAALLPLGEVWNGPVASPDFILDLLEHAHFPSLELVQVRQEELLEKYLGKKNVRKPKGSNHTTSRHYNEESDDEGKVLCKRPAHDVFRNRQQQKMAKLS